MMMSRYRSLLLASLFGLAVSASSVVGSGCAPTSSQGTNNDQGGSSGSGGKGGNGGSSNGGSSTSNGGNNSGGTSSSGGSSTSNGGNNSGGTSSNGGSSSSNGGSSANGGSSSSNGGSSTSNGGAGGSSSSTGPVTCTADLMTLRVGDSNNWIQGVPGSCGIQGSFYAYHDGSTCTTPSPISATACASGSAGCCIAGKTVVDATYAKWGCGLGMDLNSSGGTSATKSAYSGPAKGFKITLTGTVATGQKIRIMYSSAATDPDGGTAPYKEVDGAGTYSILFSDATCPAWATGTKCATVSGSAAYSIKLQVSGGGAATDPVGDFNVCITAVVPIT
jgi:hypothetical protein